MEDNIKLTIKQIRDIKFALGGEIKLYPYRNYYTTGKNKCSSWDELVSIGFATIRYDNDTRGHCYSVTDKAIEALR